MAQLLSDEDVGITAPQVTAGASQQKLLSDEDVGISAPAPQQQPGVTQGVTAPLRIQMGNPQGETQTAPQQPGFWASFINSAKNLPVDFANQQSAAGQRTTPIIPAYKNVLGPAIENDSGEIGYKDNSGNFVPTDASQHVVLTDPTDNTPKVYARTFSTNESVPSSLGRIIGTGMATSPVGVTQVAAPSLQAADRIGVSVPNAIATNSPITRLLGQVISKAPGGGPLTEAIPASVRQLEGSVGQAAQLAGGTPNPMGAGEGFVNSINTYFKPAVKAATSGAYDQVDKLVDHNITTPLDNTSKVVADIAAKRQAAAQNGPGGAVQTVLPAIQRQDGLTFDGIKTLRTSVGEMLDTGILPEGVSQGELRAIYGGLSQDLASAAKNSGGDAAAQAFQKANALAAQFAKWKDTVRGIVGNDKSGENIYQSIVRMAGTGAGADARSLAAARAAVPKTAWQDIASTAISTLGRGRNGEWSPAAFLTDYRKLSDTGKQILFGTTNPAVIPYINDIAEVSNKFVQAGKLANTSGTAGHNATYMGLGAVAEGFLSGNLHHVAYVVGGIFGNNVLARILATPATAASMARWSKVYLRLAQHPGPGSLAAFNRASGEFSRTVNGAFGTNATSADFMRAIQSPQKSAADDDQQNVPRVPTQ